MSTVNDAPAITARAHAIAAPILTGLAALHDLGQQCAALELDAGEHDQPVAEAVAAVAVARKVADLCAVGARGCVIGNDPDPIGWAMRDIVDTISRVAPLARITDGHEAWGLVPIDG